MRRVLIVPAAGRGSRLNTSAPKVLVPVNGRPMLDYLIDLYRPFVDRFVVVAHPSFSRDVAAHLDRHPSLPAYRVAEQAHPTGMLDAILLGEAGLAEIGPTRVWITWCDQVGVLPATLARLAEADESHPEPSIALPTVPGRTHPYIHLARNTAGRITRVLHRREGDQMPAEGETDMGLFSLSRRAFEHDLHEYAAGAAVPSAGTGERNFLPFIAWLEPRGTVVTFPCTDPMESVGINTPADKVAVEAWLRSTVTPRP